jgi:predicted glycoside hydrolase/deacetylase ChbG (UPF0249 family)
MNDFKGKIILNSDDFGLSDGISRAIIELISSNAITSTSLMMAAPSSIDILKNNGVRDLLGFAGVHLQLTSGKPLSKRKDVDSLVDYDGWFIHPKNNNAINLDHVYLEWKNQIENAIDLLKGLPSHLDSHHGVHRIDGIFDVYIRLAAEYNLPVRGSNTTPLYERILNEKINASTALVRNWTGKGLSSLELIRECTEVSDSMPNEKSIEVITHPGFNDKYLESISSLNKNRENDYLVLKEMRTNNVWEDNGFGLISYDGIENGIFRR